MFRNDTGQEPEVYNFSTRDALNAWFYERSGKEDGPGFISMGIGFRDFYDLNSLLGEENHINDFIVYWNSSEDHADLVITTFINRLQWKKLFGPDKDFQFARIGLQQRLMNVLFGYIAPMLILHGIISIVPLLISQPIIDIRGEVRQYMISCTLSLVCYWGLHLLLIYASGSRQ
jgi:hypothetical protein